jgi:hypothetical protein
VSAVKAYGVCPLGKRKKARYRNRKAAFGGLDTVRQDCRKARMPEEVWPVTVYRCHAKDDGGCGGWHLTSDRRVVEDFIRGGLRAPRRHLQLVNTQAVELPHPAATKAA